MKSLIKKIFKYPNNYIKRKLTKLKQVDIKPFKTKINGRVLIATKNGLYALSDGKLKRLLKGEFYGITLKNDELYVFEKLLNEGRVIKFGVGLDNKVDEFISGLSAGCHQIDFVEDKLFIADTYNNRILKYDLEGNLIQSYYPIGKLEDGRNSKNYGHINSIFYYDDFYYLMCHNETKKTGKKSQILKCDKDFNVTEVIDTEAKNAHNVIIKNGDIYYCDSYNFSLKVNHQDVLVTKYFTRGLSIVDEFIFVGGSEIAERGERKKAKGCFYILKRDYSVIECFDLPSMVQEIRCIDNIEYSFSNKFLG